MREQIKEIVRKAVQNGLEAHEGLETFKGYGYYADQIITLDQQHEPLTDEEHEIVNQEWEKAHAVELALKAQMERVIGVIDEHREFRKGALREGSEYTELHKAAISALNNLKAELLEGENERD